jgi:serine protease Do
MNVGFAIPINLARQVAEQIRKTGRVAHGYLGISGEDFTQERADEMRIPFTAGALVNAVGRGSPAEAAGLRPNDVIVEFAGKPVESHRRLLAAVAMLRPGEKAKVAFVRQGRRAETVVTVGAQGGPQTGESTLLGIQLRQLDAQEAGSLGLRQNEGLAVIAVDPRGPASGVLEEGDVLLLLDGHPVTLARLKAVEPRLSRGARSTLVIQRGPTRFALRL